MVDSANAIKDAFARDRSRRATRYIGSIAMKTRLLTALAGIPALLLLLFWPGGIPWFVAVAILMGLAVCEYTAALQKRGIWIHWVAVAVYAVALLFQAFLRNPRIYSAPWPHPAWAAPFSILDKCSEFLITWNPAPGDVGPGIVLLVLLTGDLLWKRRNPIRNVGATILGIGYIGLLFPFMALLRWTWDSAYLTIHTLRQPPPGDPGAWIVLLVLLVIWAGDSAAYFGGRAWGRRKFAPAISPNKTWAGVLCGLAASALIGALAWAPGHRGASLPALWAVGAAFGLLVGAAGQIGDLVESAMKRELQVKDFGALLPGHGGVLDRFDSLLFAAPTAYALLAYAWPLLPAALR
jgi:CDP-diglyceride synthetase